MGADLEILRQANWQISNPYLNAGLQFVILLITILVLILVANTLGYVEAEDIAFADAVGAANPLKFAQENKRTLGFAAVAFLSLNVLFQVMQTWGAVKGAYVQKTTVEPMYNY